MNFVPQVIVDDNQTLDWLRNVPVSRSWRAAHPPSARNVLSERQELPANWPEVARSQWREGAWSWRGGAGGPAELAAAADAARQCAMNPQLEAEALRRRGRVRAAVRMSHLVR